MTITPRSPAQLPAGPLPTGHGRKRHIQVSLRQSQAPDPAIFQGEIPLFLMEVTLNGP